MNNTLIQYLITIIIAGLFLLVIFWHQKITLLPFGDEEGIYAFTAPTRIHSRLLGKTLPMSYSIGDRRTKNWARVDEYFQNADGSYTYVVLSEIVHYQNRHSFQLNVPSLIALSFY